MLAIERCRMGDIKHAPIHVCVGGAVEPEAQVESIHWRRAEIWIKSKDLVQQNRLDSCVDRAFAAGLKVGLIPGEPEASRESRVHSVVSEQIRALHCEHVKCYAGS